MLSRFVLIAMLAIAACSTSGGTSDQSTLDSIPKAAADALRAQAGDAEITRVHREGSRSGEDYYEAVWRENGLVREAKVSASGKVVEFEKELRPDEVPVAVREAATNALPPKAVIVYALLMDGTYEAEAIVDGKEHEGVFAADGSRQKGDDDEAEDDDDDDDGEGDRD